MQVNNNVTSPNFGKLIIGNEVMDSLTKKQRQTVKAWQAAHEHRPNLTVEIYERDSIIGLCKAYISLNGKEKYYHKQHNNIFTELGLYYRPFTYIKKMLQIADNIEKKFSAKQK